MLNGPPHAKAYQIDAVWNIAGTVSLNVDQRKHTVGPPSGRGWLPNVYMYNRPGAGNRIVNISHRAMPEGRQIGLLFR